MRVPESVKCDLCEAVIDTAQPWPAFGYPIAKAQREQLAPKLTELPGVVLNLVNPLDLVPSHVMLDICTGCIAGILPMVESIALARVRERIAKKTAAATAGGGR